MTRPGSAPASMLAGARARLTYANAMATFAVFVALGGSSYAAIALPKASVGSEQLKRDSVSSAKVKRGSLRLSDFKRAERARLHGAPGAAGPQGPAGSRGVPGDRGPEGPAGPLLETLPSGKTLRGTWAYAGRKVTVNGYVPVTTVSFAFPLAAPPDDDPIVMPIGAQPNAACPGSFFEPQAAPGKICVYVRRDDGNLGVRTDSGPMTRFGVQIFPVSLAADQNTGADGTWAVTAP